MIDRILDWLNLFGFSDVWSKLISDLILLLVFGLVAVVTYFIGKKIILSQIEKVVSRTRAKWDDAFLNRRVFRRLSLLFPGIVILISSQFFFEIRNFIEKLVYVYLLLITILVVEAILDAVNDIYETYPVSRERPIKGYLQVAKIIIFVLALILMISILIGKSPLVLLGGLSAITAVLMVVFKDTLLGFIASIQFAMNDMVRIGDWIEMPKYGADGDVVDITVNTVKVQNWDKTITTIPTYMLVSDSFKNWRGMQESGGRRIKRAIYFDINSIQFLSGDDLQRLSGIRLIHEYLQKKIEDIAAHNRSIGVDPDDHRNGRRLTNLGTFRAYILAYLSNHPMINTEMTMLVRQLEPSELGIPIEIYTFCADKDWIRYEAVQADIFDHLFAIMPDFNLRAYQMPTNKFEGEFDIRYAAK